jgi:hypothetical protein
MTKVIILGEQPEKKELKPIDFVKALRPNLEVYDIANTKQIKWDNIELICRNYGQDSLDLMFGYDVDRHWGVLYLGHFNDGVV